MVAMETAAAQSDCDLGLFCVPAGSLSSRTEQPSRLQLLLEKLREVSIRAKIYSVSRWDPVGTGAASHLLG